LPTLIANQISQKQKQPRPNVVAVAIGNIGYHVMRFYLLVFIFRRLISLKIKVNPVATKRGKRNRKQAGRKREKDCF